MSGGHLCPDMLNKHKKGLNMKNNKIAKSDGRFTKKIHMRITLEDLQGMFLDIAQNFADESLDFMRKDSSSFYANRPEAFKEDFLALFDEFTQWKQEIKNGRILRILEYLGAYDGNKIDKGRLLTALRVLCFIGHFSDDRNGSILSFKGGRLMIPYDDVAHLERFVRTAV